MMTYSSWVILGSLAGGICILWPARRTIQNLSDTLTALLILAVAAVTAGRAGYVLLNVDYFRDHMNEIVTLASPGYWGHAAIAGGLVAWWSIGRLRRRIAPAPLIILASLIGIGASVGCIPSGCAYGREVFWTDGWLWHLRADWPDMYSINNPRLPVQAGMAVWLAICAGSALAVLWAAHRRHLQSSIRGIALWLTLFAIGDFSLQFLRADPMPSFGPLRIAQWADMALFICGVALSLRYKIG